MIWCIKNEIYIYPVPVEHSKGSFRPECYIQIDYKGRITTLQGAYKQNHKMYDKILETYIEYYLMNK